MTADRGGLTPEQRRVVAKLIESGEPLSPEWARLLFPPERREYELTYQGKEREEDIIAETLAVPLQPVRAFGTKRAREESSWSNMLIFGDNLQVLKSLLEMKRAGKLRNQDGTNGVRLIYIDPPFATRQDFRGSDDQKAYQDKVVGALFLEFLRKRLVLLRELLANDGAIYVHLDNRRAHYAKVILDEVFQEQNFRNAIVWKRSDAHSDISQGATHFGRIYDTIFYYTRTNQTKLNPLYTDLPESTVEKWYRHVEEGTERRFNMGDTSGPGGARKGNPYYEWNGVKRYWRYSKERMAELDKEGRLAYSSSGVAYLKRYLDESKGVSIQDFWDDIPMIRGIHQNGEGVEYPTQKPELLLERVIRSSSNEGDLVLDAFAGSGTTCAVAEKLGRRWIAIDCGKLAVYTIQKRMLSLKADIGSKGAQLEATPFTFYNAGLYDFSTLKELSWEHWRFFALKLFQCRDEAHTVGGIRFDGYFKGASVLVFDHVKEKSARIDEDTIASLHEAVGSRIGSRVFIIAPALTFDFQQDFLTIDGVRYYALRIPYSIIQELHNREFVALKQPDDEESVNETVDAVGFDFVRPPEVQFTCSSARRNGELLTDAVIHVDKFKSEAVVRTPDTRQGSQETLSMIMVDYDYDEQTQLFGLDEMFYAGELDPKWEIRFPLEHVGAKMMVVFIDMYGNEARLVIGREEFSKKARSANKVLRRTPQTQPERKQKATVKAKRRVTVKAKKRVAVKAKGNRK